MDVINSKCQVFTPRDIVIEVLDKVGYTQDLYGKKVMENSCGDGGFLVEIVDRYINDCLKRGFIKEKIVNGLHNDIFGAEIDAKHKRTCINNLNSLSKKYGLGRVKWNIWKTDILKKIVNEKFCFIIGNPPYITYSELDSETRTYIRDKFSVCSEGKPDYYYAFIELSLRQLDVNGRMAYLIPNNIFKNRFADKLRMYMLPYLDEIHDYTTDKLFENKLTSSAVIICSKVSNKNSIIYNNIVKKEVLILKKNSLVGKWIFSDQNNQPDNPLNYKFSDDFKAMCSIATLLNKVYILKENDYIDDGEYIIVNNKKIEKSILKQAVSPRSLMYNKLEFIIFPYFYDGGGALQRYSEEEFSKFFPETKKYLETYKNDLDNRDKDVGAQWFEYGRSQALCHINQKKLLLSTLVTGEVKVHELESNQIPYSGIFILSNGSKTLDDAKHILNSLEFNKYVHDIGINANGKSMRISANDVNNFKYNI